MKNNILKALILLAFPVFVFAGSEVHIAKDGTANMLGVKVMQQAGNTFYTRLYWGIPLLGFWLKQICLQSFTGLLEKQQL